MIRKPVVAGQFYTADQAMLTKEVEGFVAQKKETLDAKGVVSPHAGYIYSGPVAGEVLSSIKPKPTYIILGPNHSGYGKPFGLDSERTWKTPLGEVEVNKELGQAILKHSQHIEKDSLCHDYEHSIEVQLPFLQYLNKDFDFVPVVISYADRKIYADIGKGLAAAVKDLKKDITIIASSDMTHYEPHEQAKKKDMMAIEKILALDIDGFLDTIEKYSISMCGFAPAAIMMQAAIELGAKKAKLIKYNTSGDASGDYSAVVGYAGIAVY
ncbi:MAG: AmmeMemoRadiSam system protein B [Candidatus Omnitrophota bacterium]|nr:MAG: AmmeMemoRadiSam system protein B [Candidatus Omnitrophota bacterium]